MNERSTFPVTSRLSFSRFTQADAEALAAILADPEVTRSLTANATTPEQCLACARARISWHNSSWDDKGYGVWALRPFEPEAKSADLILGWCGFVEPDVGTDPEILYGFSRQNWGKGLATEAASAAINWVFGNDIAKGVSAIVFARLNPGSIAVTERLGMKKRGSMNFAEFLPDPKLAREVLEYEIWRLEFGDCLDSKALLFQAPYKAGQIVSIGTAKPQTTREAICAAALARPEFAKIDQREIATLVHKAFDLGLRESSMDWYHVARTEWHNDHLR